MSEEQLRVFYVCSCFFLSAAAAFGFVYGAIVFKKKSWSFFGKLIALGFACLSLSYLFAACLALISGTITTGFQVGNLGFIGGMAFIFTASFGQMDGLSDDRTRSFLKYRLLALLAPAVLTALFVPSLFSSFDLGTRMTSLVQFVFVLPASYFNFKHLIVPDLGQGIMKPLRKANLSLLLLEFSFVMELFSINIYNSLMMGIFGILIVVFLIITMPFVKAGVDQWTR